MGAAGVGKTREALAGLASTGRATEWVAATRSTAVMPFGAVPHLLPPSAGASRLSVAGHFTATHEGRPVVAVDDAHLLDDASAAVVHHLAARELAELPAAAIDQLLDHAFGDRLPPVNRRQLHHVSAGNPLLLREILLTGLDTGELRHRQGAWRWTGEIRATARLTEVVTARLGAVEEPVYAALEVIARLSHPLYGDAIRSTMASALLSGRTGERQILLDAAKQAKDRFDHALAERLARSAQDSGGGWAAEQLLAEIRQARRCHIVHIRLSELASELCGEIPAALASAAGALVDGSFERLSAAPQQPPNAPTTCCGAPA